MVQLLPCYMTEVTKEEPTAPLLYHSPDSQETLQHGKLHPFLCHLGVNLNNENKIQTPILSNVIE